MRVKLTIEYDGTNYSGWQRQKNAVSIQEMLERAFLAATGETVCINGAGRTDAGVHAASQVAHFDTNCSIPAEKICFAINMHLPPDIRVKDSCSVTTQFHARYCAVSKTYGYTIHNSVHAPALLRNSAAHVRGKLDIGAMRKAAQYLVGTHDFAAFCSSGSSVKSSVRTIAGIDITEQKPLLHIIINSTGFLYNMARIIVGTLIETGLKKRSPDSMANIIAAKDRNAAGITAPAKGLMLLEVIYSPEA